jgi:hypothetical protein
LELRVKFDDPAPWQVLFNIDGGPKLMTVRVDGVLCDGGADRQYGWSRFHPALMDPNGAERIAVAPSRQGHSGMMM